MHVVLSLLQTLLSVTLYVRKYVCTIERLNVRMTFAFNIMSFSRLNVKTLHIATRTEMRVPEDWDTRTYRTRVAISKPPTPPQVSLDVYGKASF